MYEFLKERDGLAVLSDPNAELATREVLANGRSRPQINKEIRRKVRKIECYFYAAFSKMSEKSLTRSRGRNSNSVLETGDRGNNGDDLPLVNCFGGLSSRRLMLCDFP